MPGSIIGVFGKQRSGKTLWAYQLCKRIVQQSMKDGEFIPCYSNIYSEEPEFININSISAIPLDLKPKIVFIDEIYNGCDAQDYKRLKEISIFINTIGKQNCLFLFTSIEPGMVYNRIRNQMDGCVLVKKNARCIFYEILLLNQNKTINYQVPLTIDLFRDVKYDTNFIPPIFDWSMDTWNIKLKSYYKLNYPNLHIN